MDKKWWKEAVVYQIYVKSFNDTNEDGIGDLRGIIEKLDYIKDLGADTIWLNPIFESPGDDNGFDISDYYRINGQYGTMDEFKELLNEAHKRGIRMIIDMVLNHTSDEHEWFKQSKSSKSNKYRDYYIWRPGKSGKEPNNWGNYFYEGSAWEYDESTEEYYLHNYSKKMPDLNWRNPELKRDMIRMMRWWLDMGIDGFRMDAINRLIKPDGLPDSTNPPTPPLGIRGYVVDREMCANQPGIHELLQEINKDVFSKYDIMVVGETGNVNAEIAINYVKEENHEIQMVFHFEIAKNPILIDIHEFKAVQKNWYSIIPQNGWITQYLSNHDTPRQVSRFGNDEIYRYESATMLATLLYTLPGTPFIYQGEEIGMTNVSYPTIEDYNEKYTIGKYHTMIEAGMSKDEALSELRVMSRDNARIPMQWNDQENAGFTSAKPWIKTNPNYIDINVEKDRGSNQSIFQYYKELIHFRRENPVVIYGDYQALMEDDDQIMAYYRNLGDSHILTIINYSDMEKSVALEEELIRKFNMAIVITNYMSCSDEQNPQNVKFQPYEARVYLSQ